MKMNEHPILVTVYVLTYKKFGYIYRNLKSVIEQDYPNIELIVSDDGSPNFPKDDIRSYINDNKGSNICNVIILDNKENVGTVKHINSLLSHAHGDLYIPLSGDDEFYNSEVISRIADEYKKSNFNVLSTSRVAVNGDSKPQYYIPHYLDRFFINLIMRTAKQQLNRFVQKRYHNFASGSTMVISASFFKKMGGHDERFFLWEDGPFIAHVTNSGNKITTRYDIISIKYKLGGISTSGGGSLSTPLYNDLLLYKNSRKNYNVNMLTRRFIKYDDLLNNKNVKLKHLYYRLRYFDVFLLKHINKYGEKIALWYDRFYIKDAGKYENKRR